ncbi:hypothetical protein BKA70DRAFT_780628 [Coprinopsis sp. MPI-PUGE-AT-0042]|nr:hypothetical protein BKA70DRAFT_780628 [Coprinopsis sp. MPI-PUGE-AT-0042]
MEIIIGFVMGSWILQDLLSMAAVCVKEDRLTGADPMLLRKGSHDKGFVLHGEEMTVKNFLYTQEYGPKQV